MAFGKDQRTDELGNQQFGKWKLGPDGSLQMRKGSLQEAKINKPGWLNNFLKEIKMEKVCDDVP